MKHLYLVLAACISLFSGSLSAQNNAVSFSGTATSGGYIDCGTSSSLSAATIRTMECWAKFNDLSGTYSQEILSKSINSNGLELLLYGTNLSLFAMNTPTNVSHIDYPLSNFTAGTWYHLAFTWDGIKENMRLYVNGVAVGVRTDVGNISSSGIANPAGSFKIGQWSDGTARYLNGAVDEVRIWSSMRTAAQIKSGMYGTVATNSAGLVAYYKLNEGSGTATANATAVTGLNGTLTSSSIAPAWIASPVTKNANSLVFDGVNDQVNIPANSLYDISTGTIECWVRPGTEVGNACIMGVRGPVGTATQTRYTFHMNNTTVGLYNGSTYTSINYTFTAGTWYHLAFVCNGTNVLVYVNGAVAGTIASTFSSATGLPLTIGIAKNYGGDAEPFIGNIDEVRIWSTQRTQAEIQAYKNYTITGAESGLVALFSFDQGLADGTNTGLSVAIDQTANNNHGKLANFALSGSTSNWSTSTLISLPVTLSSFTAARQGQQARLEWQTAQETNSSSFGIERSTDGSLFKNIGTVPARGNSATPSDYAFTDTDPAAGNNYYRLKQTDLDGKSAYSNIVNVAFPRATGLSWYASGEGAVTIQLQQGSNENYIVTDMSGHTIRQGILSGGRTLLSGLHAGTYVVEVQSSKAAVSTRFVIQ